MGKSKAASNKKQYVLIIQSPETGAEKCVVDSGGKKAISNQLLKVERDGYAAWMLDYEGNQYVPAGSDTSVSLEIKPTDWKLWIHSPLNDTNYVADWGTEDAMRRKVGRRYADRLANVWLVDPEGGKHFLNWRSGESVSPVFDVQVSFDGEDDGSDAYALDVAMGMFKAATGPVLEKMSAVIDSVNDIGQGVMKLHQRLDVLEAAVPVGSESQELEETSDIEAHDVKIHAMMQRLGDEYVLQAGGRKPTCDSDTPPRYWSVRAPLRDGGLVANGRTQEQAIAAAADWLGVDISDLVQ